MCLLFILFTNTILFSLFPISPCALSVNSDKNKDSVISSSSPSPSSKVSSTIEGSGSVPVNEILSDDEDFFSGGSTAIDFSGDGSLDTTVHNTNTNNNNGHTIVTDPGNHIITSNTDIDTSSNHGDDDTKDEDDEEDETDDDDDDDDDDLDGSEDDSEDDVGGGGLGDNHNHPLEGDNHAAESDNHDQSLDHHNPNIITNDTSTLNNVNNYPDLKQDSSRPVSILVQPSMLAAVIGGIVVSLLCAILLAMFIIYRTRKKDEGSYICEPSLTSPVISHYGKASCNKFYDP